MTTKIEWTDRTWNPVISCDPVSAGCRNCWAARMATRHAGNPKTPDYHGLAEGGLWKGMGARFLAHRLGEPLRWRSPSRVAVCLMGDLFHESIPGTAIDAVWGTMAQCPQHTFQVLTKRPKRMLAYLRMVRTGLPPLPNVHLGVSVEDQKTADERIPHLLRCPAAVRWVSIEPCLGPVEIKNGRANRWSVPTRTDKRTGLGIEWTDPGEAYVPLDWVVLGGESGPGARWMGPGWAREVRDDCASAGVPFFMKQMARKAPIPEDLNVREWPRETT